MVILLLPLKLPVFLLMTYWSAGDHPGLGPHFGVNLCFSTYLNFFSAYEKISVWRSVYLSNSFLYSSHGTSNNDMILFISIYFLITGNWCIFFFSFERVQFFKAVKWRVLSSVILSLKSLNPLPLLYDFMT